MVVVQRTSPIAFAQRPLDVVDRKGWPVVQAYENEGAGPHIIDVSHGVKLDVQDLAAVPIGPLGVAVPGEPGQAAVDADRRLIVGRLTAFRAVVWQLDPDTAVVPQAFGCTDITDAELLVALIGTHVFDMSERLSALDMTTPARHAPFFLQGPLAHVPCQVAVLSRRPDREMILVSCARGYASHFVHALLYAGESFGLRPAGERALFAALTARYGGHPP